MKTIYEQISHILGNYGDAPQLYEPNEAAFAKILICIEEMEAANRRFFDEILVLKDKLRMMGNNDIS